MVSASKKLRKSQATDSESEDFEDMDDFEHSVSRCIFSILQILYLITLCLIEVYDQTGEDEHFSDEDDNLEDNEDEDEDEDEVAEEDGEEGEGGDWSSEEEEAGGVQKEDHKDAEMEELEKEYMHLRQHQEQ